MTTPSSPTPTSPVDDGGPVLSREEAREAWATSGLTYGDLNSVNLGNLCTKVGEEMKSSGLIKGSYRMKGGPRITMSPLGLHVELRCKSFYFENREAVTFNDNGFIGFAGWADDTNVQPILRAFIEWVAALLTARKGGGERV